MTLMGDSFEDDPDEVDEVEVDADEVDGSGMTEVMLDPMTEIGAGSKVSSVVTDEEGLGNAADVEVDSALWIID